MDFVVLGIGLIFFNLCYRRNIQREQLRLQCHW